METLPSRQQKPSDGFGALYHRIYSVDLPGNRETALGLMQTMQREINQFSPQLLARFEKVEGTESMLQPGDKFQIYISGPWNGPVEVRDVTPESFVLVTLEGHLEAGEIHFRVRQSHPDQFRFEIESLARSRDRLVDFVYDKVPIAKVAQTEMWKCFCTAAAKAAASIGVAVNECADDASSEPEVNILTERRDEKTGEWVEA